MKLHFFLPQIAPFDTCIDLFYLVLLTQEFFFAVFFLQLTQYISVIFISFIPQHF